MAKLVEVWQHESTLQLTKRQMLLVVDENLTMVMDVKGLDLICESPLIRGKQLEEFSSNFDTLTNEEAKASFEGTYKDLMDVLGECVPCVGCRRSVEELYNDLKFASYPIFDPLLFTPNGMFTVKEEFLKSRELLGTILQNHSSRLNSIVEKQTRNKKSHRCALHSLDIHRPRQPSSTWREVWECMGPKCRKEITLISSDVLETALEKYLTKHRFCSECRTKVLLASYLLTSELDPTKEKGYVASLYDGIKRFPHKNYVLLPTSTEYLSAIINRAQPEVIGRERHAKTIEMAQEEVVTCLGICVGNRLHGIHRRLKEAETVCRVLAAVTIEALAKKFEVAVDAKQGIRKVNLLCEELKSKELAEQLKQEKLKLKKKKKKERRIEAEAEAEAEEKENINNCSSERCSSNSQDSRPCSESKLIAQNMDRDKLQELDPKSKESPTYKCDDVLTSIETTQPSQTPKKPIPQVKKSAKKDASRKKDSSKNKKANKGGARKTPSKVTSKLNKVKNNLETKEIDHKFQGIENQTWHLHIPNEDISNTWLKKQSQWTDLSEQYMDKWMERASRSSSKLSSRDRGYSSEYYSSTGSFSSTPEASDVAFNDPRLYTSNLVSEFDDTKSTLVSILEKLQIDNLEDEGTEYYIPQEDINQFMAQASEIWERRKQFRQQLQDKFNKLLTQGLNQPICFRQLLLR